jgi:hypothetical protein
VLYPLRELRADQYGLRTLLQAQGVAIKFEIVLEDLIDLAMMSPTKALLAQAIHKAGATYGPSIHTDLAKAIDDLRLRPHRLDECMRAMRMTTLSTAALWQRIRALGMKSLR